MPKFIYFVFCFLITVNYASLSLAERAQKFGPVKSFPDSVSLISLIANSEKYHNKEVSIQGVYGLDKAGGFVFLTKEHKNSFIVNNAVCFYFLDATEAKLKAPYSSEALENGNLSEKETNEFWKYIDQAHKHLKQYDNKNVIVFGVFDADYVGDMGSCTNGTIREVSRFSVYDISSVEPILKEKDKK
ncbi:MAG: hypothetical protein ACRBDL_03350 [Alphaproteobacteria bacterium]